jgi:long-chain acyl-CoA synthetase
VLENKNTLFDMLVNSYRLYRDRTAFVYNYSGSEFSVTYEKFFNDILLLSKAFKNKKMKKGSKVMFLSDNRYGWIVTDMAIVTIGAISVPRGSDTPSEELKYIMEHSECDFLIIETEDLYQKHANILKDMNLKSIFVIEAENIHTMFDNFYSYNDLLKDRTIGELEINEFISTKDNLQSDDIFTIIYTSGTTGTPKGVVLTHKNIMYNLKNLPPLINISSEDVWLSILPAWHIFERAVEYLSIANGCKLIYSNI